jgi:hypothetical protein
MTIETYRTEYKALEAKRGEMTIEAFVKAYHAINARYLVGKGSFIIPVVL